MSNIPTAEELFYSKFKREGGMIDHQSIFEYAIEFAKLHLEAGLKAAREEATIEDFGTMQEGTTCIVDKESITEAYPISNIK
jgi:hypothetical protein